MDNGTFDTIDKHIDSMEFLRDYWHYLMERKKWFLIPVITILLLTGFLLIGGGTASSVSQLIYAMF
ncbi:MAG: hypothetical protein JKY18_02625 [Flavobacteriales bacterium]|nr:hypothetical protein [Flavobacteriales bacterium]